MANPETKYTIPHSDSPLCEGFLHWLQLSPDAPALHINDTIYSYRALYELAGPVVELLKKHPQKQVGIYCTADVSSYVSILAISLAGACYVPLNAKYPNARLRQIIRDCGLKLVLVHGDKHELAPVDNLQLIDTAALNTTYNQRESTAFIQQSYAYILYTSGTTGLPKGVPISKRNVNAFFRFFISNYDFNPSDRFLQPYELSFDVSVFSIFCAWNAGASVYVVKDSNAKYLEIFKTIRDHKITVTSMVPGVLKLAASFFHEFHFPDLRYSFFSGDALYQEDAVNWKKCIPYAQLHNFYGPTETTIVCSRYCWEEKRSAAENYDGIVPLGSLFPGMQFILLHEDGSVIDPENYRNTQGELCLHGEQVIDFYVNHCSPESFIEQDGKTWYKTGDIVNVNHREELFFRGRSDSQIKINGYRVELTEIEATINYFTGQDSKVVAESVNGLVQLIAFVEGSKYTERELRNELSCHLPGYMMLSKILFVEAFPKNLNGKTDLNELKKLLHV
jgi:amino acid adenylation domain-containing protein